MGVGVATAGSAGQAANTSVETPTGAAPEAGAGEAGTSAPDGDGSPSPDAGSSEQTTAEEQAAALEVVEPEDDRSDWIPPSRLREARRELRATRGEAQTLRQQLQQREQELGQRLQAYESQVEEWSLFQDLLDANPEIADQLYERIDDMPSEGRGRGRAVPRGGDDDVPEWAKSIQRDLAELRERQHREERGQQEQAQQEFLRTGMAHVTKELTTLLGEHDLDEAFLPQVRDYVLGRAAAEGDLDFSEIPVLFKEWLRPTRAALHRQIQRVSSKRAGTQGRAAPATPAGTATPPVHQQERPGANDKATKDRLKARLRDRMAWG